MIAGAVGVRETARLIIVTGDDVRVEIAVSIAASKRAAGIGVADETIVNDAAGLRGIAGEIEPEMAGRSCAVINTAITDIHGEAAGGELRLGKTFPGEPREIARRGRNCAGEVSGDDLILALVALLAWIIWLDGNDVRQSGELRQVLGSDADDEVQVAELFGL